MLKKTLRLTTTICAMAILAIDQPAYAQFDEFKLTASDAAADDLFGWSVSISGNYAIVGARKDDNDGTNSGSAYIYVRDGQSWTEQTNLAASDAEAFNEFGWSVSISGNYAIVGAPVDDNGGTDKGSAYIFVRDGESWTEQAKLTAGPAATSLDEFGVSVSISGNYAIVGVYFDDDDGTNSGSAYIYVRDGQSWTVQAKLTASDAAGGENFGNSVSISGDYAIIGARWDDDAGTKSGSAYLFAWDGQNWTEQAKLTASDAAEGDQFGNSVSISGDYAIVGAYEDDDDGTNSGSAYLFVRDGQSWTEQAKLTASDATTSDLFGWSVSISGDYAIVGAIWDDDAGGTAGSAYLFVRDGQSWTEQAELTASDAAAFDQFGYSVSISGEYAIIGARFDDDGGSNSGSAYLYSGIIVGIDDERAGLPTEFALSQNYPNPFNPETRISFALPEAGFTRIIIYDQLGREVSRLVDSHLGAGYHEVTWNATNVSSGIYFYRLQAGDFVQTRKMVLLK